MRFHVVMFKTAGDLLSLWRVLALVAVGLVPTVIWSLGVWQGDFEPGVMSLEVQTSRLVDHFMIVSFFWMAGYFLAYLVVGVSGLELVDREFERGTLLLMVSKPISRTQLLLGKYLALVLTALLLEAIILLGSVLLFWVLLGLDPDIVTALLRLLPWIFLLSFFVILLFASISIAMSTMVANDVVRSVVFTVVVLVAYSGGPIMRAQWNDYYEDYYLYYIDASYNLGNAYVRLLEQTETGRMTPQYQAWLGLATGAYKAGAGDVLAMFLGGGMSDPDIGAMSPSLERTTLLSPIVSICLCLLVTVGALGVANAGLNRKEVQ